MRIIAIAGVLGIAAMTAAWAKDSKDAPKPPAQDMKNDKLTGLAITLNLEPVNNSFRLGKKIISGSCLYGEAGSRVLAQQGVKTIISMDGARPDEKIAKKFGMRYVHIPVTYSGITRAQSLSIARAVRDLQGRFSSIVIMKNIAGQQLLFWRQW